MKTKMISAVLFLAVAACPAWGQVVKGVVFSATDQEIEILIPVGQTVEVGTPVELWAQTPDGNEVSVGTWAVARCEICLVYATPVQPAGTPKMGQKALIGQPVEPSLPEPPAPGPLVPNSLLTQVPPMMRVSNVPPNDANLPPVTPPIAPPVAPDSKPAPVTPVTPVVKEPEVVTPPVTPPVAPPVTPQPTPTEPQEAKLSDADQRLLDNLNSDQATQIREAAKYLYRGRFQSRSLMDQAAQVLEQQYNKSATDNYHVDAMAWICKALWASGDGKYVAVLDVVAEKAESTKLKKYAAKYGQSLRQKSGGR